MLSIGLRVHTPATHISSKLWLTPQCVSSAYFHGHRTKPLTGPNRRAPKGRRTKVCVECLFLRSPEVTVSVCRESIFKAPVSSHLRDMVQRAPKGHGQSRSISNLKLCSDERGCLLVLSLVGERLFIGTQFSTKEVVYWYSV